MTVRNHRPYLILCLILLPVAVFFSFSRPWTVSGDIWETAAAIRAVSDNILHPTNPLLNLPGNTSPRFTPYTVFWGAVVKFTGLGLFTIVGIAGVLNYLLFVTGLGRFVRRQFRDDSLPTYTLLVMLIVWGTGYSEVNAYQFVHFFLTLPLVGLFAYGICFHALGALRVFLNNRRWHELVLYTLLSIIAFVTHPITAAFGFVAAAAVLLDESDFKQTILFQIVPLLALGAALLWPYFDYLTVLTKGSTETWYKNLMASGQFEALGIAIIGVPIIIHYAFYRRHLFLAYGLGFCLLIYILCTMTKIQIGSRFILFAAIFMHLAIAQYILEHRLLRWDNLRASLQNRGFAFALIFILLIPALFYRARELKWCFGEMYTPPFQFHIQRYPSQRFFFLSDYLDSSDVVMANDTTGWVIPAITGAKLVAQLKGNPIISGEVKKRRNTTARFLYESLSRHERRRILRGYNATHILLDHSQGRKYDPSLLQNLRKLARKEVARGKLELYKLRRQIN